MALLSLKDIGKIYVSENSVAIGIRGINLDFNIGEFVAITGKSGAGKSTLLNVLSGMDSYEEGEMYINGNPTSHYIQSEWEEYRKEYISFVFQDYNIIDSFTVLENVELALINITDLKERRKKALELIKRVGLTDSIKSKGSKLSGGQKQRTVIARALAKDSPIILADEPTGNLDSKSSKEIIELLSEVAKDKLLIVVTHNYDDFKDYATRHIRIYDGGVESDDEIKNVKKQEYIKQEEENKKVSKKQDLKDGLQLGFTIFKAKPRLTIFMCLLMLVGTLAIFFLTAGLADNFDIYKKQYLFNEYDGRVIITKSNGSYIEDSEIENLKNKYNLTDTVHYDYLLDNEVNIIIDEIDYYSDIQVVINKDYGSNIYGKYPTEYNECLLYLPIECKPLIGTNKILVDNCYIASSINKELKVVGIKYYIDNNLKPEILVTKNGLNYLNSIYYYTNSQKNIMVRLTNETDIRDLKLNNIEVSYDLPKDSYYIASSIYKRVFSEKAFDAQVMGNLYYENSFFSMDSYLFTRKEYSYDFLLDNTKEIKEIDNVNNNSDTLVLGIDLYNELIESLLKNNYSQASLFFKNNMQANNNIKDLKADGYLAVMSNTTYKASDYSALLLTIVSFFGIIGWFIGIIFIGLFVNLCTKKSLEAFKNDLGIMRSMGITEKIIRIATYVRVFICIIPALLITFIGSFVIFRIPVINPIFNYLYFWQYLLIFIGMIILCYRVARRQNKRIFNVSVKKAIKEGDNND